MELAIIDFHPLYLIVLQLQLHGKQCYASECYDEISKES